MATHFTLQVGLLVDTAEMLLELSLSLERPPTLSTHPGSHSLVIVINSRIAVYH